MDHPLEAFARDSDFFIKFRLIPSMEVGVIAGALIGVGVGLWQGNTLLGIGSGFISAIGAGVLLDLIVWHWL